MTKEQYELYQEKENEIKRVRDFCFWCGDKHKEIYSSRYFFDLVTKGKDLFLHRKCSGSSEKDNTYEIPKELQERIIKVTEDYLDEKEQELLNI